jgi:hypothetical protein
MIVNDEYGTWEVTEGIGCTNKCLLEPSALYLEENPNYNVPQPPSVEIRLEAAEAVIMEMLEMMML